MSDRTAKATPAATSSFGSNPPGPPTVKVTFTAPSTFTFDPPSLPMTAAGTLVMLRHPETAGWTFVSVNELPSPEYSSVVSASGSTIDVTDRHTSNGGSHYTVTVHDAGGNHTSENQLPDDTLPMIMNQ